MKISTFDTTLRDGTQGESISFSVDDKLIIAQKLDELGIDYIEGGWPGSNPKDQEFFKRATELTLHHARLTAFGSTRFAKNPVHEDRNGRPLVEAGTPARPPSAAPPAASLRRGRPPPRQEPRPRGPQRPRPRRSRHPRRLHLRQDLGPPRQTRPRHHQRPEPRPHLRNRPLHQRPRQGARLRCRAFLRRLHRRPQLRPPHPGGRP